MMKSIMQIAAILVASVLLAGCNKPQTVTKIELDKAKAEWQEPKVSIWYYVGSKDGYHHYLHRDLPGDTLFRVSKHELVQGAPFPVTRNQKKWKVMPWGVHAPRDQKN
jgi:hypothetical protein